MKRTESVTVIKQGIKTEVDIDSEKNMKIMKKLMKMNDKDNCYDIFKNSRVENNGEFERMYETKSNGRYFRDKTNKCNSNLLMSKIKLLLGLKCFTGILYIKAQLKKIVIAKNLFAMDIQDGHEVFIRKELSQQQLPLSFRYYDPIIHILNDRISPEARDYLQL